jgi:hypothetical protein
LQKKNIQELKNDKMFLDTKDIFDKYEKNVKNNRKNNVKGLEVVKIKNEEGCEEKEKGFFDVVTDVVLGKDVNVMYALICSHCHSHNGLKHPDDSEDLKFYCYNCKTLNDKSSKSNR